MSISLSPQSNYIHYFVLTIIIFTTLLIMYYMCPGCNVPIEKNTGCNHMQCIKCKAGFCWLCLSLLDVHLPHVCNRYDSADSADDDFERQALYTVTRYEAHDGAAAFTLNQYTNFEPKKFIETYWFLDQDKDPARILD